MTPSWLRTWADGKDLPAYVTDLAALHRDAAAAREALPDAVELWYAAKANPSPPVLRALRKHVTGFEVASGGELAHVRAAAPGAPLCFGGPGKTEAELAAGLAAGVRRFHVESVQEAAHLGWLAARVGTTAHALVRVNLPVATAGAVLVMGGAPSPFGVDPEDLGAVRKAAGGHVELHGVHAHLASGLDAPAAVGIAAAVLAYARDVGLDAEVNVGGGMAVDYRDPGTRFDWPAYGEGMAELATRHPGTVVRIEPGRSIAAYSGWYVTRVLDVKHSAGKAFAVLAGGTHHLRTPVAKGHDQPFTVLPGASWDRPWDRPSAEGEVTLVGQLCTPKDVLARDVPVDRIRAGDVVAFGMAGAYAWNISHRDFLMHPPPGFHTTGQRAAPGPSERE